MGKTNQNSSQVKPTETKKQVTNAKTFKTDRVEAPPRAPLMNKNSDGFRFPSAPWRVGAPPGAPLMKKRNDGDHNKKEKDKKKNESEPVPKPGFYIRKYL